MISQAGWWTQTPSVTPLQPKNEMLLFGLRSTSYDWPGWSMDSNPILHLSPAKEMKSSFLDYIQLLMISQACRWTWTPSTTCLQPKNKMLIFSLCSTSDDQPGWLMNLNPICHPSAAKKWNPHFLLRSTSDVGQTGQWTWTPSTTPLHPKKNEMLVFRLRLLLMICLADWWTWTSSANPILPKKWNAQFLITFNFWWSAKLVNWLKVHLPAFSSQ